MQRDHRAFSISISTLTMLLIFSMLSMNCVGETSGQTEGNDDPLLISDDPYNFNETFERDQGILNLLDGKNWRADNKRRLSSDSAIFLTSTSGPEPSPSPEIGLIYNPDDDYSFIISRPLEISSGTLEGWFSTDKIFYGDILSMSMGISLMRTDSSNPDFNDRAFSLIVRDGGIGYRTTPQTDTTMIVHSGITSNTWYRFKIDFNCTVERAHVEIHDASGILLGSANNTEFMCSTDYIRSIELTTARDRNGVFTKSFWDEMKMYNSTIEFDPAVEEKEKEEKSIPGFEIGLFLVIAVLFVLRRKTGSFGLQEL